MTTRDLFRAIGLVDDDLILDADVPPRPRVWRRVLPAAACLTVVLAGVAVWRAGVARPPVAAGNASRTETAQTAPQDEGAAAPVPGTDGSTAGPAAPQQNGGETDILNGPNDPAGQDQAKTDSMLGDITPAAGNGSGPSLAVSAAELLGDTPDPDPDAWPETLPVYRNALAGGELDEAGMRDTLRAVLQALGRDPALAEDAALVFNWSQDQIDNAGQIAAALYSDFGAGSMLEFLGGMAQLELTLDDGSVLTVQNSRTVSLGAAGTAPLRAMTTDDPAANTALPQALDGFDTLLREMTADDLSANADLLQALGGFDALRITTIHNWTDGRAQTDAVLTRSGAPGTLTGLQVAQDGRLAAWTLSGAASAEQIAELPVLSPDEAETLLQRGSYLGAGYEGGDPAQGTVADVRLVYLDGAALYYVPVWQFTVDFGTPDPDLYSTADPDTGEALHTYFTYSVPAVSLDALADAVQAATD